MTIRSLFLDWRVAVLVIVAAITVSFIFGGTSGGIGMILGIVGSISSALGLYAITWLLGASSADNPPPKSASALVVMGFLIKVPIFVICGILAQRIDEQAPNCFLWGLGLVYFSLVGWAVAKSES